MGIGFLDESKSVRSLFKEAQSEADSAAVVNFLAQASARTTESTQNLALYYSKQSVDEVKEIEIQTSRQVTRLKTELLHRTKTNLLLLPNEDNERSPKDESGIGKNGDENGGRNVNGIEQNGMEKGEVEQSEKREKNADSKNIDGEKSDQNEKSETKEDVASKESTNKISENKEKNAGKQDSGESSSSNNKKEGGGKKEKGAGGVKGKG